MDKKSELKKEEEKIDNDFIFSKENVNMGHQKEFDYLKAFEIFIMGHTLVYDNYSPDYLYGIVHYIGYILGANVFMILMGIGMKYSRHHEPKNYISRGIGLLTLGQLVNFFRDTLPCLIAWWTTEDKFFLSQALLILQNDILSFAGFAFLFLGLLKKLNLSDDYIVIIGIILNCFNFVLSKIMKSPNNFLLSQFLGYFVLTDAEAIFPLCSYFIFVAFGHWIGGYYQKMLNKDKFYDIILIFFLPIVIIYYYFRSSFPILPEFQSKYYYSLNVGPDAILCCMSTLLALSFFHKINILLKGKTPEFIKHMAKNLNEYYIISFLFILPTYYFLVAMKGKEYPFKLKYSSLFACTVLLFSRILIIINDKYIHFAITTLKNPLRNIVFTLIWITTIICVIYIYPKVDVYSTMWNNYLMHDDDIN